MANLHAAAAAAAQAQAAHQVAASNKAVQAAAVAAASGGTPCTEPLNSTGTPASHPSSSAHNASAVGQFLANPTPLPPLHSSAHHAIASHPSHHMYFPGASNPTEPNSCSSSTTPGIPPASASAVTALSSLV